MADVNQGLHEAIQREIQDDDVTDGAVVVGWVMIVETLNPDGTRTLSRLDRGADGDRLPTWTRNGYLFDGLHGGFPDPRKPRGQE